MTKSQLIRLVNTKYNYYREMSSDIIVNCNFCPTRRGKPDTDGKLYISWEKEKFHCFKCEARGRVADLFNTLQYTMQSWRPLQEPKMVIDEVGLEKIPANCVFYSVLPLDHPAQLYVQNRGFTTLPPETLFCENYVRNHYSFGPRIIFPILVEKEYKGFQARAIEKHPAKYVNAVGFKKSHCFFNWDRGKSARQVFITEGLFDALKFFPEYIAMASFGKVLSQIQISMLLQIHPEEIYICYDPDAKKEMKQMAILLSRYRSRVYYINIPPEWKDPGEMPKQELFRLIRQGIKYDSGPGIHTVY